MVEALGRGYYENGAASGAGYRNGYRRGRLRTAEGAIGYGVPQVADRAEPFDCVCARDWRVARRNSNNSPSKCTPAGLSVRDIEAAFRDATGISVLSRR